MKRQPKIIHDPHDPAYDFRVRAEFAQRFPDMQFLWFFRNPSFHLSGHVLHSIKFRADRADLRALHIPIPKRGQGHDSDFRPGRGAPLWMWHIDARCRLPFVVQFWLMDEHVYPSRCPSESHPLGWLVPARLESTPYHGDLDSQVWADVLRQAA